MFPVRPVAVPVSIVILAALCARGRLLAQDRSSFGFQVEASSVENTLETETAALEKRADWMQSTHTFLQKEFDRVRADEARDRRELPERRQRYDYYLEWYGTYKERQRQAVLRLANAQSRAQRLMRENEGLSRNAAYQQLSTAERRAADAVANYQSWERGAAYPRALPPAGEWRNVPPVGPAGPIIEVVGHEFPSELFVGDTYTVSMDVRNNDNRGHDVVALVRFPSGKAEVIGNPRQLEFVGAKQKRSFSWRFKVLDEGTIEVSGNATLAGDKAE